VFRGIRAALSKAPDTLLMEAANEFGEADVKVQANTAALEAALDEAVAEFTAKFGGRPG
jgi:hypothetical protein